MENQEAKDKIITARVRLQKENPFFSYLIMGLKIQDRQDVTQTCAVDIRSNFYYNAEFVNKLNKDEIKSVLAHEVMHVALFHLSRLNGRDIKLWNIATDIAVNSILKQNGFVFSGLLNGGFVPYNNEVKIANITIKDIDKKVAEEIYNELIQKIHEQKQEGKGKGGGEGIEINEKGFDKHIFSDESDLTEAEVQKIEKEIKKCLAEASAYAKIQGNSPAGLERFIDDLLENKLNWKEILYKYITREIPVDFTYMKPSKKSQACGFYMPSMRREEINISVAIDTSGSIGKAELTEFLSELVGIAKSFDCLKIHVLFWDTECNNHYTIENGSIEAILNYKIGGGGGTDFSDIYEYLSNEVPNNKALVFFTDGFATFPSQEEVKTLWVLNKNSCPDEHIPYGDIARL